MAIHPIRAIIWGATLVLVLVVAGAVVAVPTAATAPSSGGGPAMDAGSVTDDTDAVLSQNAPLDNETQRCIACHEQNHPGVVEQFKDSAHFEAGIACTNCHGAEPTEPDAEEHFDTVISPVVSPKDCENCHAEETQEFHDSMHDEAAFFSASGFSNDDTGTGAMPTGWNGVAKTHNSRAQAEAGCQECHGARLKVLNDDDPTAAEDNIEIQGYPNQGMGRLNPDGSVGSCAACHPQHEFSIEQARSGSKACQKCHLGPDHPQTEIYEETKHSTVFHENEEEYDLTVESDKMTAEDIGAPTCAVCHMSGMGGAASTHDVSSRLKWEAEPVYSWPTDKQYETGSEKYPIQDDVGEYYENLYNLESGTIDSVPTGAPNPFAALNSSRPDLYEQYVVENEGAYGHIDEGDEPTRWDAFGGESHVSAEQKRARMKTVCTNCHTEKWVNAEFEKRDNIIQIYNSVYMAAGEKYYSEIADQAPQAEEYGQSWVDSIRYEMWHHEGRRMRMGALMNGPDFEHWNGGYMVKNDVLKFAHFQSVYENTDAGKNVSEDVADKKVAKARQPFLDRIPTGLQGTALGAIVTVGFGVPIAGLFWWRSH